MTSNIVPWDVMGILAYKAADFHQIEVNWDALDRNSNSVNMISDNNNIKNWFFIDFFFALLDSLQV